MTDDQHYRLPPPRSRPHRAPPVQATGIRLKALHHHAHLYPPSRPHVTGLVDAGIVPDNTPDLIHKGCR
ncbi:MAG: hypothetical protein ACRDRI_24980 [Pseudonocardiaceae bacterium]